MKMVIDQLEGILKELKDVAKELREVRLKISLNLSSNVAGDAVGSWDGSKCWF